MAEILEADLKEVSKMLEQATRPNVRKELERIRLKLDDELRAAKKVEAAKKEASELSAAAAGYSAAPVAAPAASPKPVQVDVRSAGPWTAISTFALDLGGYDKPLVTIDIRMKGVEELPKEAVTCDFSGSSFDLKVMGFEGKNHRMIKTNLDKDIVVADSSVRVKKNHVIITLQKVKGQYGYDSWTDLVAKGARKPSSAPKSDNPQDSIMGMMKDMYNDGDDSMKKIIGEAMYKAQRGEKYEPKAEDIVGKSDGLDDL